MMQGNRMMLVIAVIAGVMATVLAFTYISAATRAAEEPEAKVDVLVVENDLPANHLLDPDVDLRVESVGAKTSAALVRRAVPASDRQSLAGVPISSPLPAGVPLLYAHLTAIQDLALAPGTRAMSINVQAANLMGGILVPGDHVDIIASFPAPPEPTELPEFDMDNPDAALGAMMGQVMNQASPFGGGTWVAEEVLTNVRVIAIAGQLTFSRQAHLFGDPGGGARGASSTVTLELTLDQAKTLIQATAGGSNPITLLLRPEEGPSDSGGGLFTGE